MSTRDKKWNERHDGSGRFTASPACDFCGKPIGNDHYTDEEVCGNGDGPGFYLCDRKRCTKQREGMSVEERRMAYQLQRTGNRSKQLPEPEATIVAIVPKSDAIVALPIK